MQQTRVGQGELYEIQGGVCSSGSVSLLLDLPWETLAVENIKCVTCQVMGMTCDYGPELSRHSWPMGYMVQLCRVRKNNPELVANNTVQLVFLESQNIWLSFSKQTNPLHFASKWPIHKAMRDFFFKPHLHQSIDASNCLGC